MFIQVSLYTQIAFIIITVLTFGLFMRAVKKGNVSKSQLRNSFLILFSWIIFQGTLSYTGFYQADLDKYPPRLMFVLTPNMLMMVYVFFSKKGRKFVDGLDIPSLILLSVIRVPVEITLYTLFLNDAVPELMTFEGRNFDILAGLSAPIIYYLCFIKKIGTSQLLITWNIISTALLMFIVFNAIFSVPSPIQLFGKEHPNIGLLFFPFTWLAAFVAPIVLFSHFVISRRMILLKKEMKDIY